MPDEKKPDIDPYLFKPVHLQEFKSLIKAIPKRIIGLVSKAIGIKMLLFYVATFLLMQFPDAFPWYAWLIVYICTMFGWDGLKFIKEIKK